MPTSKNVDGPAIPHATLANLGACCSGRSPSSRIPTVGPMARTPDRSLQTQRSDEPRRGASRWAMSRGHHREANCWINWLHSLPSCAWTFPRSLLKRGWAGGPQPRWSIISPTCMPLDWPGSGALSRKWSRKSSGTTTNHGHGSRMRQAVTCSQRAWPFWKERTLAGLPFYGR